MKTNNEIKQIAYKTFETEILALEKLKNSLTSDFVDVVKYILKSKGRVIISGIGKSANIANKIVSTLNSTGTPAIFMHAADAIHGDLGIIRENDIVICISKSGETPEIKILIPLLKNMGNLLIGMVGNVNSYLAQQSDFILDTTVDNEACPYNLAPTASTTAQLVMGDALAVCLLESRGFSKEDFAKNHPGGVLGKKLYLRVSDLYVQNEKPEVKPDTSMDEIILEITSKRLGATAVIENGNLLGIITDGDLRRMLHRTDDFSKLKAKEIMTPTPKFIEKNRLVVDALDIMRKNNITQIPVMDNEKYVGIIHIHDILKEGLL